MDLKKLLLEGNLRYKQKLLNNEENLVSGENIPKYPLLILTCMDPRIDVFRIFQLNQGDAFVLRNAGNTHTPDVLRSVLVATLEYGVKYVVVLGHFDCGMAKLRVDMIKNKIRWNISLKDLIDFFRPFKDELQHLNEQVKILRSLPQLPKYVSVIGMMYDIKTGIVFENNIIENYRNNSEFWKDYPSILKDKTEILYKLNSSSGKQQSIKQVVLPKIKDEINKKEMISIQHSVKEEELEQIALLEKPLQLKLPQIIIPPVHIPQIKIRIPKIYKNNTNCD